MFTPEQVAAQKFPCPLCGAPTVFAPLYAGERGRIRNAQVGASEAAAVAINDATGEVVYCFANPGDPIPERYAAAGFRKEQFHSLSSLRRFCDERGLVNDVEYDNKHDGYGEEMQRQAEAVEREHGSAYRRERDLAARAIAAERVRRH